MSANRIIAEAIQKLSGTQLSDQVFLIPAKVLSVDLDNYTCECEAIGGAAFLDLPNVRLMAEVDDGILLVPKISSTVLVTYSKRELPFICLYSELERVEVHGSLVQLNDGSFGGMVMIAPLIQKINALENIVNDLITQYNLHTHAALDTPTLMLETGVLTVTDQSELENTIVTHGK